jgi:colicin import membrane protein
MGVSFIVSAVIHLTVFLLVAWGAGRMTPLKIQDTYYVDIVNLPVAAPQAGSPSQKGSDVLPAPTPPKTPVVPMAVPKPTAKSQPGKPQKAPVKSKVSNAESSDEFAERMAKLKQADEAKQADAAIARMQEKIRKQGAGRAGMPAANGKEAGSDYLAYLQSRLKDAFHETISFTSKNPEMTVRLFIDTNGKLSRKKTERSSGDRAFEISVLRAIDAASEKFTPPPGRKMYEGVFVFKREGISQNKP